jgi:hypothetical protein
MAYGCYSDVKGGTLEVVKAMGKRSPKAIGEKLLAIPPQFIHLVTIILMILSLVVPMTLPVNITDVSRKFVDVITKLPDGSKVLIVVDYSPASFWEVGWVGSYVLDYLCKEKPNTKFVGVGFYIAAAGDLLTRMFYESLPFGAAIDKTYGKVYGKDFVNLGWLPGGEPAYAAFAENIHVAVKRDHYGNPIKDLPLMTEIKDITDFDLIIGLESVGVDYVMRQFAFRFNIPVIMATTGESTAYAMPYVAAGQIKGCLYSVRGVAEYERLMGKIGIGTMFTNATSLLHSWLFLLIVIGNLIPYVFRKKEGK